MLQPGRTFASSTGYRFGFNGMEMDDEVKGRGNQYDYKLRIYDPRLGRFLSTDFLADDYPQLTPYQFASNQPIESFDVDGLERMDYKALLRVNGKPLLTFLSEGPKIHDITVFGFSVREVKIPYHIRIEYNGQHYVFADNGPNSTLKDVPAVSGYSQYSGAIHYAADYDKFLADPEAFVKTHKSEEQVTKEWEDALAKIEMANDIVQGISDGLSSGRGGSPRSPRMPRIRTPKPNSSAYKAPKQQKVVTTPNSQAKQQAVAQQKPVVKPPSNRAPEFPGGQVTETGFLNSAESWLGPGYKHMGNGRYVSADGLRQVRYGKHETSGSNHHGHFEAYDQPADKGGRVIENTVVTIVPDQK